MNPTFRIFALFVIAFCFVLTGCSDKSDRTLRVRTDNGDQYNCCTLDTKHNLLKGDTSIIRAENTSAEIALNQITSIKLLRDKKSVQITTIDGDRFKMRVPMTDGLRVLELNCNGSKERVLLSTIKKLQLNHGKGNCGVHKAKDR